MINFENSFHELQSEFYANVLPSIPPKPELLAYNKNLANKLGVSLSWLEGEEALECFSGSKIIKNSNPLAMVYAGHQFGNWVPRLGDGRAVLLGELIDKDNQRWDIQLKGSGKTPFSRSGDGKAVLGPILREYLISEAMNALRIPTTLALTVVKTGEKIQREALFPGAILTRVAKSHIRVGTFQYFASRGEYDILKTLSDYVINRHFPAINNKDNKYSEFLKLAIKAKANLISKWMSVSFIHGVMNTDNCSIIGDTIDYGPCAFMDTFKPETVFSSIDTFGRYSYKNQPKIGQWNLIQLANCLLPLLSKNKEESINIAQKEIDRYPKLFESFWLQEMRKKLALKSSKLNDTKLITELLDIMEHDKLDFTLTFSSLYHVFINKNNAIFDYVNKSNKFKKWTLKWKSRLESEKSSKADIVKLLCNSNPSIIPRNHLVEEAIKLAVHDNNYSKFFKLMELVSKPFCLKEKNGHYLFPPKDSDKNFQTFCGT